MSIARLLSAGAETGHTTDPAGDFPDIRRLDYADTFRSVTCAGLRVTENETAPSTKPSFLARASRRRPTPFASEPSPPRARR